MGTLDMLAGTSAPPKQQTKYGVEVIPYNANFDNKADLFLPWLWSKLKEDGLVSLYYPGQEETGFANFVKMFSGACQIALVVSKDEQGPDKAIGFVSWEPMAMGAKEMAVAGFIFLKEFWDHKHSVDAANKVMEYWFTKTSMDSVIGIVASRNVLAKRFLVRIGWKTVGTLPDGHIFQGVADDAVIFCMTKSQWEATCHKQPYQQ